MATIKVKFCPPSEAGAEGFSCYRIAHARKVRLVEAGCTLFATEWDARRERVLFPAADAARCAYLSALEGKVADGLRCLREVVARLQETGRPYTADNVAEAFVDAFAGSTLFAFAASLPERLCRMGRVRTGRAYASTLNSFARFRCGVDLPLRQVDSDLMTAYEAYLRARDVCPNTSSFYMRNLRTVYNRAVEKGLTPQRYPFRHVYTGIDKTVKRAISLADIRRIREWVPAGKPGATYSRDLFLFSFYTRGMSFVDMAFLRKSDLKGCTLSYRRRKTGQLLTIRWEPCMQEIVDRYDTSGSPYLLPIIRRPGVNERRQYESAAHLVNRRLKTVGLCVGVPVPLTMYVARHAWASIARHEQIPLSVIAEGMGHDSESTTQIYLMSLDSTQVDRANQLILSKL